MRANKQAMVVYKGVRIRVGEKNAVFIGDICCEGIEGAQMLIDAVFGAMENAHSRKRA